jgi:hypothetical protein
VKRHRSGIAGLAVLAAVAALPVVVSAYRRARRDYTQTPEFRALIGDYVI